MHWFSNLFLLFAFLIPTALAAQENDVDPSRVAPKSKPIPTFFDRNVQPASHFELQEDDSAVVQEKPTLKQEKSKAKEKRKDVAEQIRIAERQVQQEQGKQEQNAAKSTNEQKTEDQKRLRILKQLDVILAQREQQTATLDDVTKELKVRNQELRNVQNGKLGTEKPYSFLLLDQLHDELAALQSNLSSHQSSQLITNEDIIQAKQSLEQKEQAYRFAKEQRKVAATLSVDNSCEALEVKLASENLEYRKRRLEILKIRIEITSARIATVEKKIGAIRRETVFSEEDLKTKLAEFEKLEAELRRELPFVEFEMEQSNVEWLNDHQMLKTNNTPTPKQAEELELRRRQRQALQAIVSSLNFRLELINQSRQTWENRYQFANSISTRQQDIEMEESAIANKQQRDRDLANRMLQLDELRKSISALDSKLKTFPDDGDGLELRKLVERQKEAIRGKMLTLEEDVAAIQSNRRDIEKLLADFQGDANRYSLGKMWETTCYYGKKIWKTELTTIDDRPITIGKVILAFAIFVGGFWLARFISRRLRGFLTRRLRIEESAAAAFQSLAFYCLVVSFLLGALNFVSIPLTVFTFLGGALAIGVGFGSQNILSNFISGLILLAERPVKVGDLIQMDDLYGNVEAIGARSTIVRTGTNLRLIVPNSKILENNVINLTHGSHDMIRTKVAVGVAYGSDAQKVRELLLQAAKEHRSVLKDPEPFVLFRDFADSSLNFELHFWLTVRQPMDQLILESELRYRVDKLFNDAGVVIAFPQSDLHIDASNPIDIRLVAGDQESGSQTNAA